MWEIIRANQRKSALLVIIMAALLFTLGYAAGELIVGPGYGMSGLFIAFLIWMFLSITAYFQGKSLFMRISGAQQIQKKDHPRLFNIVEEMKIAAQLPALPEIYIIDDPAPNAFATGRRSENSAVAVTTGLLNELNRDELQGVIAHEIGHIKNRDILFMTMIGVMMGAIVMLADITMRTLFWTGGRRRSRTSSSGGGQARALIMIIGLLLVILSPILAHIIYLAASRKREYLADASSAQYTRYPEGLASALEKISYSPMKMRKPNKVTAPMFIVNPLEKMKASSSLFSTHPPTEKRVEILRSMAGGVGYLSYDNAFKSVTGKSSSVMPKSALAGKQVIPGRPVEPIRPDEVMLGKPSAGPAKSLTAAAVLAGSVEEPKAKRARETTNAIWRARRYTFIDCPCGATLKIPPEYKRPQVKCLRCSRVHPVDHPQNGHTP